MRIKRRCKNCGTVIDMSVGRHYLVTDANEKGFAGAMSGYTCYKAFDCQNCGCQFLAGIRLDRKIGVKEEN